MHILDIERGENFNATISQQLKHLGVKHRSKKTNKKVQITNLEGQHVFKKPLQYLPLHTVSLKNGSKFNVPQLVHELCSYISCSLETEGLFRKAGSTARQKEIKLLLDAGCELSSEHHVIDVANVLKLFFRELPEPLIPYMYHDTFLQCLIAKKDETVTALLTACLLLPPLHLSTLYYFMEFLHRVVSYSELNKMDIRNIAIVMTPTVMPIEDKVKVYSTQRLNHHVQVLQILLENAEKIGEIPPSIIEALQVSKLDEAAEEIKRKKKRRSGSLTRIFHGFKKMVTSKSVDEGAKQITAATPDLLLTPCLTQSAKKRKGPQQTGFSSKRRRELLETLPQASALTNTPFKLMQTPVCQHPNPEDLKTPINKQPEIVKQKQPIQPELKTTPLVERDYSEFVRIPKSEYEEIKSRVSAIENRISQELSCAQAAQTSSHVQTVYEKTLEEVESLSSPTTEQLAKRLSRELKIRRSSEQKIIRSPSARKIGSIRRRSQDNVKVTRNQSCQLPRVTLKRGRPNTVLSGLPQPSPVKDVARSSSFHNHTQSSSEDSSTNLEKWASAELYLKKVEITTPIIITVEQRDSLARLRSQNAGMVLAKAKLFNELSSDGSGTSNKSSLNLEEENKTKKKSAIRRGGTFPRQNPTLRRQRAIEHPLEKENDVKKCHEDKNKIGPLRRSPRRANYNYKPLRIVRQ